MGASSYVKGSLILFKFYLANICKLHQLPQVFPKQRLIWHLIISSGCGTRTHSRNWSKRKLVKMKTWKASPWSCLAQWPGDWFIWFANFILMIGLNRIYNGEFDKLKSELRQLHAVEKEWISYRVTLLLLFRQRTMFLVHFSSEILLQSPPRLRVHGLARKYICHPSPCFEPVSCKQIITLSVKYP